MNRFPFFLIGCKTKKIFNGDFHWDFIIINILVFTLIHLFCNPKYHKPGTILYILLAYDDLKYLTYSSLQTYPTNIVLQRNDCLF